MSQTENASEENNQINSNGDKDIEATDSSAEPDKESKKKLTDQANSGTVCELCDVKIVSEQAAQSHFDGAKHKKKVKRYQTMKSLAKEFGIFVDEPEEDIERKLSLPRLNFLEKQVAKMLTCSTCNISVTGFENMLAHLGTTKHQQAVLAANGYKPPNAELNKKSVPANSKSQGNKGQFQQPSRPVPVNNRPNRFTTPNKPGNSNVGPPGPGMTSKTTGPVHQKTGNQFQTRGRGRGRGRGRDAAQGMRPLRPQILEQTMTPSFTESRWYNNSERGDFQSSKPMGSYESNCPVNNFGGYAPEEKYSFNKQMYYAQESPYESKYPGGFNSNEEQYVMNQQSPNKRPYADDSTYSMPPKKPAYYNEEKQYSMDYNHGDFSSFKNYGGMY